MVLNPGSSSVRNPRLLDLSVVLRLVLKRLSSANWLALAALVLTHGGENLVPRDYARARTRFTSPTECAPRPRDLGWQKPDKMPSGVTYPC